MMRPVWNSYLVQEGFFPIHKEGVRNLEIEPHSDGLLTGRQFDDDVDDGKNNDIRTDQTFNLFMITIAQNRVQIMVNRPRSWQGKPSSALEWSFPQLV